MHTPGGERAYAIEPLGETHLLLRFGTRIDAALNAQVHAAADILRAVELPGLIDIIPAYATLALHYDAAFWTGRNGMPAWRHLADTLDAVFATPPRYEAETHAAMAIPVCYGGEYGPDLDAVAAHCRMTADEVVARHQAGDYRVAMIGFAPGFAYLLGLDAALHMPRRASPRLRIPAGSVAIGGAQTGIYPSELPAGWQIIGRTPLSLFDAGRDPPCLLAPGDQVRFEAIDAAAFAATADA